jgi:hypothetical protein
MVVRLSGNKDHGNRMDPQGKLDERDAPVAPAKKVMPQVSNAVPTRVASAHKP